MAEVAERIARAFYANVEAEPELRALYGRSLRCPILGLAAYIGSLLGVASDWPVRPVIPFHRKFRIDRRVQEIWIRCMASALEAETEEPLRSRLLRFFSESSLQLINTGPTPLRSYGEGPSQDDFENKWRRERQIEEARSAISLDDAQALADIVTPDFPLLDLLAEAASLGHRDCAMTLVRLGAPVHHLLVQGSTLAEHPELAAELLAMGADVSGSTAKETPLIRSCRGDKRPPVAEVRALLLAGAPVDARGRLGRTALHYAASAGNREAVSALLEYGADANAADSQGQTPRDYALRNGKSEVVRMLEAAVGWK